MAVHDTVTPVVTPVAAAPLGPRLKPVPRFGAALHFLWTHRWFALIALLILGGAGWQGVRWVLGPAVMVDQVQRGELVQTVVASGHVETPFRVDIASQITGTVAGVQVAEGQSVAAGQPLVTLEASELSAALIQAQGALAQSEAVMRQLAELTLPSARENLIQARATLLNTQQIFDRSAALAHDGYTTRVLLDDAQKGLDVARAAVRTAELQVFTASPGGSDAVIAQSQYHQAQANLATATARLGYATIIAPRAGVLISRNVERGTVVEPSRILMVLAPLGDTQLVLQLDERNIGLIAVGQQALASADAYPDQRFSAVLAYINPGVDITRASVEVKLTVTDPPPYLRQDMTVSVDIEVARRSNALSLASRSVRDAASNAPWIMGIRAGRAYHLPVTLGIRGNSQIEMRAGVGEGNVAVPAGSGILTGQRLRPITP